MIKIEIPISRQTCVSKVKRQLSKVGKRAKDNSGKNIFSEITLSSAEEPAIIDSFYVSIEVLKGFLEDYISTYGYIPEDEDFEPPSVRVDGIGSKEQNDVVTFHIMVSDSFNEAYIQSLSQLIPRYLEDAMLAEWWTAINAQQMKTYSDATESDIVAIRRCFNKKPPYYPKYPYTRHLSVMGTGFNMKVGHTNTVTYTIDYGVKDDIQARSDNRNVIIGNCREGFTVKAIRLGTTHLTLYSKHDEEVCVTIRIHVQP